MSLGFMSTFDSEAKADIVRSALPQAELRKDKFGNWIAKHGDHEGYLNRPGFTGRDVLEFGGQALAFSPATRAGAAITKNFNGVGK